MYAGGRYGGLLFAGKEFPELVRRIIVRRARGVGGSGFTPLALLDAPLPRRRRRTEILAMREDDENLIGV